MNTFRKYFKRTIKAILLGGEVILFFLLVYFACVLFLSDLTYNSDFKQCDRNSVEIFVRSNGVHTDIILPAKNDQKDWRTFVHPSDAVQGDVSSKYIAFGWGDKGFYLNTPKWSDLKFSTAFKAAFFLSTTAMHVGFYSSISENDLCKRICISKESYARLIRYVESGFELKENLPQRITGAHYGNNDLFYEGSGTYSLFCTCNTWANGGLKEAGIRSCVWTIFSGPILKKYE